MASKIGLAVLISGGGSNLQALIDACRDPAYPAEIRLVISNIADAYGVERAKKAGIPALVVSHKDFASREEFEQAMITEMEKYPIDLVCQAGFMRILTPLFVKHWEGRLINIHPSLLPKGKGTHGLKVHTKILGDGETESGCTIHYVTEGVDEGDIILQRSVPVLSDDTPETLAARVLEQEHIAYPEAVKLLATQYLTGK
ncbi:MAG TPA: phosphoribosylglycinamide formyltransferase [Alphaproteobacteria bacterium]|nr:phosphoribosylglycinamide formyltransferase [Alphaproteobacteria bacterium]